MFVQATEAAYLPPVINAAMLMAEAGWTVNVVTAPLAEAGLAFPEHPRIAVDRLPARPTHVMTKFDYLRYTARVLRLARNIRPDVIYASDPLGAGPGLLAARATGARLVYHEHDSPAPDGTRLMPRRMRAAAARRADIVIFPNRDRAELARSEIGFAAERLRIVWNVPRRGEMPPRHHERPEQPMIVYYHGHISPTLLPESLVGAIQRFQGAIRLDVLGYEVSSAGGYLDRLQRTAMAADGQPLVRYLGVASRDALLARAAQAHLGVALMPASSSDVNLRYLAGASNKVFDYMAAGLPVLVSDLPEWRRLVAQPGFAHTCDPTSVDSIAAGLRWFHGNPLGRREMGARNRAKISIDWNYDTAFAPVMDLLRNLARC